MANTETMQAEATDAGHPHHLHSDGTTDLIAAARFANQRNLTLAVQRIGASGQGGVPLYWRFVPQA